MYFYFVYDMHIKFYFVKNCYFIIHHTNFDSLSIFIARRVECIG